MKNIRKACEINDKIFLEIVLGLRNKRFTSEKEIYNFILKRFRDFGAGYAYKPLVANNCSEIHPKPRNKKLERGFLILDFGARVNNVCSDMTRTLFIGKANNYEKKLYGLVLKCHNSCVMNVKAGAICKDLGLHAKKIFGKYDKYFTHSLGHGLGYRVHQNPRISRKSNHIFKEGDLITIEPGLYIKEKNICLRIEDTILVKKRSFEILSKSSKRLIEVNYKK